MRLIFSSCSKEVDVCFFFLFIFTFLFCRRHLHQVGILLVLVRTFSPPPLFFFFYMWAIPVTYPADVNPIQIQQGYLAELRSLVKKTILEISIKIENPKNRLICHCFFSCQIKNSILQPTSVLNKSLLQKKKKKSLNYKNLKYQ